MTNKQFFFCIGLFITGLLFGIFARDNFIPPGNYENYLIAEANLEEEYIHGYTGEAVDTRRFYVIAVAGNDTDSYYLAIRDQLTERTYSLTESRSLLILETWSGLGGDKETFELLALEGGE